MVKAKKIEGRSEGCRGSHRGSCSWLWDGLTDSGQGFPKMAVLYNSWHHGGRDPRDTTVAVCAVAVSLYKSTRTTGKQRPHGAQEQPDCQTSWKEAEEKQSLHGGGLEGGHSRLWQLREPGVLTSQWLGCSWSFLVSPKERMCPSTADQQASCRDRNPLLSASPVPGTRPVLQGAG